MANSLRYSAWEILLTEEPGGLLSMGQSLTQRSYLKNKLDCTRQNDALPQANNHILVPGTCDCPR